MTFIQWIFLLGGLAVVGPVIAHLLAKPRYKRLPFTMLRFLHTSQAQSHSRRNLRDLLILLLRCAIIVLIAMLFARPMFLVRPEPKETRYVHYLGLDNSMSMGYSDGSGSYFSKLVDSAVEYIRSTDEQSVFNIFVLGSADWTWNLSKEQAIGAVRRLKIVTDTAHIGDFLSAFNKTARKEQLSGAAQLQSERSGSSRDVISISVISDFTPNTLEQFMGIVEPVTVDNIDYKAIVSSKAINNAAITNARVMGAAGGKLTVNVTVANYGQVRQNRWLTANTGTSKSTPVEINLSANQRRAYQVSIDVDMAGHEDMFVPVELSLSDGDGLEADDTYYLSVFVPERRKINVILADNGKDEMFLLKTAMNALSRMNSYDAITIRQVLISDFARSEMSWANVIICSAITERLGEIAPQLKNFVKAGGTIVFFMTDKPSPDAVEELWSQNVLPALPERCVRQQAYIQPKPYHSQSFSADSRPAFRKTVNWAPDDIAAKSLTNYRIDRIVLTGYLECEPHPDSSCVWQLQNGIGFVYSRCFGDGAAILVNTSVDDSLGSLTKSSASTAFCRYLLGRSNQVCEYGFACNEQAMLPVWNIEGLFTGKKQFWVEGPDGHKRRAAVTESFLLIPASFGTGWIRTLTKPTMYAGINLPQGETDMTKPAPEKLAGVMNRIFLPDSHQSAVTADATGSKEYKPFWKIFAWLIILLLLTDPVIANRLKR